MKKTKTTETKPSMGSTLNKYELVVIYPTSENEIGVEKTITEKCKKRAIKVVEVDKWGTKTMAYEIKKQSRGYYLKLTLEGAPTAAKELERDLQMDDKLLRFLLIRI
jgi:small subunit ribosomal protein S6